MSSEEITRLVQRHRAGFSLAQDFYRSPAIFDAELDRFLAAQWLIAGHVSEIPQRGDYFVLDGLSSSVIVARGADGAIHAMHNVCRHRGAKVCEQERGRTSLFTCRYHGWSYHVDGSLAAWRHMPDGLDRSDFALRRCGVAIFEGVILLSLDPAHAPDPVEMLEHTRSRWARYQLARCKVAATQTYRLAANWKLAIENNLECYHCLPSHPEYTAANAFVKADEKVSESNVASFSAYHSEWRARLEGRIPTGSSGLVETRGQLCRAGTWPLAPGRLTGSKDGQPLAPLLGTVAEYDESVTTGCIGFLSYMAAMCDHALLVTYVPQSVDVTHAVMHWLVRDDAREGVDYEPAQLRWLWDETTKQDKNIIELNAAGVATRGYQPGPYSSLESVTADFVARYLRLMAGP
jgi:phenylpropionate dioxygenase-like ring-hydroxylating dioxygenase large terminal subunit